MSQSLVVGASRLLAFVVPWIMWIWDIFCLTTPQLCGKFAEIVNLCYVFFFSSPYSVPTKNCSLCVFVFGVVKCGMDHDAEARHMLSSWVSSRPSIPSLFRWIPKTISPSPCRNFVVKLWAVVCQYSCCQILAIQQVNWLKGKSWRIGCESHEKHSVPWCWMKFIQDTSIPNACHPLMPPGEWSQLHNLWMTSIKIPSLFWMDLPSVGGCLACAFVGSSHPNQQLVSLKVSSVDTCCGKLEWLLVLCRLHQHVIIVPSVCQYATFS